MECTTVRCSRGGGADANAAVESLQAAQRRRRRRAGFNVKLTLSHDARPAPRRHQVDTACWTAITAEHWNRQHGSRLR